MTRREPSGREPAWAAAWRDCRARLRRSIDDERLRQHEEKALLVLTLVIGAIVGLVVVVFILITENLGARLYPAGGAWQRRLLVPTLGALVSGWLLARYFQDARGSGIPQAKAALSLHDGFIPFRTVVGKFTCSSLSLASGIALGREGPSVQLGAGIASTLGRRLGLGPTRIKTLLPVGTSAAIAAAFNTPIAAVLFTLEEVMGNLHAPVLGSIVLGSATSWMVLHLLLGDEPLFHVPAYQLVHPVEFVVYTILGLIGGLVSVVFVQLLLGIRRRFLALPGRTLWLQPAAGGLFVGTLGVFVPAVLGVGYGHVGEALNGSLAIGTMALLLALKLVATAACYGSGNAGGIFGPSLFLGAMMGGTVGGVAHWLLPDHTGGVGAYALVGMGAAFAGIVRAPMTSVIMIFEITRDYTIIVPLMIANLASYFVSARLRPVPVYEAVHQQEGIHLPPSRENRDELLRVAHAMRPVGDFLSASDTVAGAVARISGRARPGGAAGAAAPTVAHPEVWLVVDAGVPIGGATQADLEQAIDEGRGGERLVDVLGPAGAARLAAGADEQVHPDQAADVALRRLAGSRRRVLPVVSRGRRRDLLGSVSVTDVLAAYERTGTASMHQGSTSDTLSPRQLLAGVASTVLLLLAVSGVAAYRSRESRLASGQRALAAGEALLRQERAEDAVQQFRLAVSALRSTDARRALGLALLRAGTLNEAETYLQAVVGADAADGPANLGLARIAAAQGDRDRAATHYERAMAGSWPDDPQRRRLDAGFEFVDVLARTGETTRAAAELLRLESVAGPDAAARARAAEALDALGAHDDAADVWQRLVRSDARNVRALTGLGESRFALADYPAALAAFRRAHALDRSHEAAASRLALCEDIVALDPTAGGLRSSERYRRSVALLERTLSAADACLTASPAASGQDALGALAGTARTRLGAGRRPPVQADATEDNLRLAGDLWLGLRARCPAAGPDDPLDLVLGRRAVDAPRADPGGQTGAPPVSGSTSQPAHREVP